MYGRARPEEPEVITTSPTKEPAMNLTESVPTSWDDVRDGAFFRIVGHLLDAAFLEQATNQLAAFDSELAADLPARG